MGSRIGAAALGATLWVAGTASYGEAQGPEAIGAGAEAYAGETTIDADSQSVGHSDDGRIEHPFTVETGDRLVALRPSRFGTRELVGLLHRAADYVARASPGARLAVGDLSSETGGPLAPHGSHQSGRDADVGFYMIDAGGRPVPQGMFTRVVEDGTARRGSARYVFDDARNWQLLVAFVDDPMAEVQHVLLAPHLRNRLLEHARATEAPEDQIRRVTLVTEQIRGSENHDDHFHVRIYCSVGDRPQCLDRPPLHPWYDGTPSPRAVAAARVADLQRAAALRRQQEHERRAEQMLARGRALEEAREHARAQELLREPSRQEQAERRRAAALSRDERRAIVELRGLEREAAREQARGRGAELGRAAELAADERRWIAAERRRADRLRASGRRAEAEERARAAQLRASIRRAEAEERRRAARLRASEERAAAMLRRGAAQQAADRRRANQLLQRSEQLERDRTRASADAL